MKKPEFVDPASWPAVKNTIVHGDCVEGMKVIPDESVDAIVSDPPFNLDVNYDGYSDSLDPVDYLTWTADWIDQCVRVLKPTGSLFVMVSEEFSCELKVVAEAQYALRPEVRARDDDSIGILRSGDRLKRRHEIQWYFTFGQYAPRKLTRSHTTIHHFVKSFKKHKWNPDAVRVPSARQAVHNDKRANPDGRLPDDTWVIRPQDPCAGFTGAEDVQHVPRVCGTFKDKRATPNQCPEQLIGRIIRLTTDPGDLVLAPFSGSGTFEAVAKKLGREFVGFEKSDAYYLQARLRVEAAKEGDPLDRAEPVVKPQRRKKVV